VCSGARPRGPGYYERFAIRRGLSQIMQTRNWWSSHARLIRWPMATIPARQKLTAKLVAFTRTEHGGRSLVQFLQRKFLAAGLEDAELFRSTVDRTEAAEARTVLESHCWRRGDQEELKQGTLKG